MRLAEQLKEILTMDDILKRYGFHIGYSRRMRCPFHKEKTASFLVHRNNKSWKCYGCGEGGTVIDFVMKLFEINFGQACIRLNSDFGLGFTDKKPSPGAIRRKRAEDFRRRCEERKKRLALDALCAEYRWLRYVQDNAERQDDSDPVFEWYCDKMIQMAEIEHLFEIYDFEGEEEWWKNYEHLQKKIS